MVFQHAEETGAAGAGCGPAFSIAVPRTDCSQLPEPPGHEGPGPARTSGGGAAQDAAGGCQEPGPGEVSLGVTGAGQHPYLSLLRPANCPPAQQHPLSHLQDHRAHLLPRPAELQCLHSVSQQGLQPVWLQPQPAPHPGNAFCSSCSPPHCFGWVLAFSKRTSCTFAFGS